MNTNEGCVIVDCNNRDWIYSLVVISIDSLAEELCKIKTGNGGYSTFYPKDLSPQEVIDSINEAYANRTFVEGSRNSYVGVSKRGLIIEMYINKKGKIISAFPKE